MTLFRSLGARLGNGLDELTVTTNGSQLARFAAELRAAGVRRINVSLDTLSAEKFAAITRWGRIEKTLDGIFAAKAAGLAVKINTVALKGVNEDEFDALIAWCGEHGFDLCLIETMPMGEIDADRTEQYLPLSLVRSRLRRRWTLHETDYRTGGPARYFTVAETGRRIGFITPMTHNFCESCNRVRLTCTGTLYMCLGQDDAADLRARAARGRRRRRAGGGDPGGHRAQAQGHDFVIDRRHDAPVGGAAHERDRRLIDPRPRPHLGPARPASVVTFGTSRKGTQAHRNRACRSLASASRHPFAGRRRAGARYKGRRVGSGPHPVRPARRRGRRA